jgi:hypothetical protein
VPDDAITFTPHVLSKVYGDGRALFGMGTLNSRPAYWVIRGCSSWTTDSDRDKPYEATNFVEMADEILFDLEEEFGSVRCGTDYEFNSMGRPYCLESGRFLAERHIGYPTVDSEDGCHWHREDWPDLDGVPLQPHPFALRVRILGQMAERGGS